MCSHYQTLKDAELLLKKFGAPNKPAGGKYDMWPRYPGVFIRRPVEHDAGDEAVPEREAVVGRWGLISAMTKADGLDKAGKLSTVNARSETAAKSYTFGNAWRRAQHCIIPADAIFEPGQASQTQPLVLVGQAGGPGPGLGPRIHNRPVRLGALCILAPGLTCTRTTSTQEPESMRGLAAKP